MKTKRIERLPSDLDGYDFKTDDGVKFTVVEGEYFPQGCIAQQHNSYLDALRVGLLVSVSFRGHPVPVIKVNGGVVRLKKVEAKGETTTGSREISTLLGVLETRQPMGLYLD